MVRRKLKLAYVVCAVSSLNNRTGATRKHISKFCALRFGVRERSEVYDSFLERAVASGLLLCLRRRYWLAKLGCRILWGKAWQDQKHKTPHKKKRSQVRKTRKRRKVRKAKCQQVKSVAPHKNTLSKTSSLFKLWCLELKSSMTRTKRKIGKDGKKITYNRGEDVNVFPIMNGSVRNKCTSTNGRAKNALMYKRRPNKIIALSRKVKFSQTGASSHKTGLTHKGKRLLEVRKTKARPKSQRNVYSSSTKCKLRSKSNVGEKLKKLKLKLEARRKQRIKPRNHGSKIKPQQKKQKTQTTKKSSSCRNDKARIQEIRKEVRKEVLRQTKGAIVHGKSWDHLNKQLQQRERENLELIKSSKLVQKILTCSHGSSWDDFNKKLQLIKANSKPEMGLERGNFPHQYTRTTCGQDIST